MITPIFFFLFIGLAIAHAFAMQWYLYWLYPWFDIPIHFLGGVVVGLGVQLPAFSALSPLPVRGLGTALLCVIAVGLLWEFFEWMYVIEDFTGYTMDTTIDLIMDITGGATGFFIARALSLRASSTH